MPSARVTAIESGTETGNDQKLSAFASLLSVAIASNVARVQNETGQPIAPIANPSLKDGMGAVAADPGSVARLLKAHGKDIQPMVADFLRQFDVLISNIENRDEGAIRQTIAQARENRRAFFTAFAGSPAVVSPAPVNRLDAR